MKLSSFIEFLSLPCSRTIGSKVVPGKGFTFGSNTFPALDVLLFPLPLCFEPFVDNDVVDTVAGDDEVTEVVVDGCESNDAIDEEEAPTDDDGMLVAADDNTDDEMFAAGWR